MTIELEEIRPKPYHKLLGPFKRDTERDSPTYNVVIPGQWTAEEFHYLSELEWLWTEKVDGTNVRVFWDGAQVSFHGRTDKAQLPERLVSALTDLFPEDQVEQAFTGQGVTLYGEGYGGKINKGDVYRPDESFILFDVKIGPWWLKREDVVDIAHTLGVDVVPVVGKGDVDWALRVVRNGLESTVAMFRHTAEGLVGTPRVPLFNRAGERIIMKVKSEDFR